MLFSKDGNSINEITSIKASIGLSKTSDIFNYANNYSGSSLSGINTFRSSDRSSYTALEIATSGGKNHTYDYAVKSKESNKNDTQAIIAAAIQPDLIARRLR
ncbi:MAG: hypothetical protein RM347_000320 [Nostoc sp. ChiQUE02]|uniref:hypothetical protein n=1 Tax=Nostoc sp. ChiQUE02 TaxID=3075377 RepID=UPI002AD2AEC9|nr:hypothetical protein [Nostoc sp. ChiQUE02]MDZ8235190.1 hypothetical protein [Nostoc sp. ChiQUE02]